MLLTKEALEAIFTSDIIEQSTYTTRKGHYIRLINTHPTIALVPALYPNLKAYRAHLSKFDNIPNLFRVEYNNGIPTGNKKMDLTLDTIIVPKLLIELPPHIDSK